MSGAYVNSTTSAASLLSSAVTFLTATSTISTSSTTAQIIPDMVLTAPPAGTYLVTFSANCETSGVNSEAHWGIFAGGTLIADTDRKVRITTNILGLITLSTASTASPVNIVTKVTLTGTEQLDVRYLYTSGGGAAITNMRTLTLLRIG